LRKGFSSLPELTWIESIQRIFHRKGAFSSRFAFADAVKVKGEFYLSVDAFVGGRHFPYPFPSLDYAYGAGYRVLAGAISDLAPSGSTPYGFFLSIEVDRNDLTFPEDLFAFFSGMGECAKRAGISLFGGNITRSSHFTCHLTVIGKGGAPFLPWGVGRKGDLVWVTGTVGDAMVGVGVLSRGYRSKDRLLKRYFYPEPRIRWGKELRSHPKVVGITDLTDGILKDLYHLIYPNSYGVLLKTDRIPRSSIWRKAVEEDPPLLSLSFYGGDDYELLFLTRGISEKEFQFFLRRKKISANCIGEIIPQEGFHFDPPPPVSPPPFLGYDSIGTF
jgi:thiamine-monophosphate kinase